MQVKDRFLHYVSYPTMSSPVSGTTPSTEKQRVLAGVLCEELISLGLEGVTLDEHGYVYAVLPANTDTPTPVIGLVAHMDTSPDAPDSPIAPQVIDYKGGDITLNAARHVRMSPSDFPTLSSYVGQHLIVTDGTTLLGADDKAGVAEIVSAIESLIRSGAPHGKVMIAFTPDEEIGEGTDHFNHTIFRADYAYTIDGGELGEVEYENFNAAAAVIRFHGVSMHPGSAKGKMKNAAAIAVRFHTMLPTDETPEKTEGYEGFYHLTEMVGDVTEATLRYIIRDHDRTIFEERKETMRRIAAALNAEYGDGTVDLLLTDNYYNMKEKLADKLYIVERAQAAFRACGVTPVTRPIRGGTDGARLSYEGLPCPNLSTGGVNFHSLYEYIPVESLEKMTEVIVRLLTDAVGQV